MNTTLQDLKVAGVIGEDSELVDFGNKEESLEHIFGDYRNEIITQEGLEWVAYSKLLDKYYIQFEDVLGLWKYGSSSVTMRSGDGNGKFPVAGAWTLGEKTIIKKYYADKRETEGDIKMENGNMNEQFANFFGAGAKPPVAGEPVIGGQPQPMNNFTTETITTETVVQPTVKANNNFSFVQHETLEEQRHLVDEMLGDGLSNNLADMADTTKLAEFNNTHGGFRMFLVGKDSRINASKKAVAQEKDGKVMLKDGVDVDTSKALSQKTIRDNCYYKEVVQYKASAPGPIKGIVIDIPEGGRVDPAELAKGINEEVTFDAAKTSTVTLVLAKVMGHNFISTHFGSVIADKSAHAIATGKKANILALVKYNNDVIKKPTFVFTTDDGTKPLIPGRFVPRTLDDVIDMSNPSNKSNEAKRKDAATSLLGKLIPNQETLNEFSDADRQEIKANFDGEHPVFELEAFDPKSNTTLTVPSPFVKGAVLDKIAISRRVWKFNEKSGKTSFAYVVTDALKVDIKEGSLNPHGKYKDVLKTVGEGVITPDSIKELFTKISKSAVTKAKLNKAQRTLGASIALNMLVGNKLDGIALPDEANYSRSAVAARLAAK